jgi:fumarate reductase subunit C
MAWSSSSSDPLLSRSRTRESSRLVQEAPHALECVMSRRPYVQTLPKTTWWLRQGRYKKYIAREITCIFIGVYTAFLLFGVVRLSQGPAAYQGFLNALDQPLLVSFHVLALAFASYNSVTWFGVTPKAMRFQIGEDFVPDAAVAGVHYAGWAAASLCMLFLAGI